MGSLARDGKAARALGVGLAATAGLAAAGLALVWPRHDASVERRWAQVCRHRYAHRGLHNVKVGVPENSLTAFELAREAGFGSELDVHMTADGGLVVIHDSDIRRVCGREGNVEQMTLAELTSTPLLGADETIPSFSSVLAAYEWHEDDREPPAPLVVEVKTANDNYARLTAAVMEELDRYNVRYVLESFDPRVLGWLRANRPEVIRGQLSQDFVRNPGPERSPIVRLGATVLAGNALGRPDFVAYRFEDRDNPFVRLCVGGLGAHLVTWTIRNREDMLASEAAGAPVIFEGFIPDRASTIDSTVA